MELLDPIQHQGGGCLCCSTPYNHLPFDTVMYNGFGGWRVTKNGETYYEGDVNAEFDSFKTLGEIELDAEKDEHSDWRAICFTPLHGETYQRQFGKWVLVEQNEGFA